MNKVILICLLAVCSLSAQVVDIKQIGYHKVMVADTLYSQHSQEYQAQEMQLNLRFEGIYSEIILAKKVVKIISMPESIQSDTVFMDTEQIKIVNAIWYQSDSIPVSDIIFFNEKVVDTVSVTPCFEDFDNPKTWFHVGDLNMYPHKIWFPTKEFEFIGVMFSDSLTTDEKANKTKFVIERTKDRMSGNTFYEYLPNSQQ